MMDQTISPEQIIVAKSVLPIQNTSNLVDLCFKNINFTVGLGKNASRKILNDVTGICPGGQITAILGSSGAGKTSLLNVLACRIDNNEIHSITGELTANGKQYNYNLFSQFASYVMQNDVLLETLTPKEAFKFVANLKYTDASMKNKIIDDTIKSLKLEKCQNTFIGGTQMKGLSGGERKRTSIGYELISNPNCILLDEPTSGLDSFTAFYIINQLRLLAQNQGKTIIFTIHQPNSDIYLLFDRILLLVQGQLIYQGPRSQIVEYFNSNGYKCPEFSNPLDYYLSIMNTNNEINKSQIPIYFSNYKQKLAQQVIQDIKNSKTQDIEYKIFQTSTLNQIKFIAHREALHFTRNQAQMKQRIYQAIQQGLIFGGIFWGVGQTNNSFTSLQSLSGALFFIVFDSLCLGALQYVLSFTVERDVFLREESSKLYSTTSYFIGKQLVDIPFCIIFPLIENLILYWMIDLDSEKGETVLIHILICTMLFLCSNSLGLLIGCSIKQTQHALDLIDMTLMPLILMSGYYANTKQFFPWISWIQWFSPAKYAFEALLTNQVEDKHFDVDPIELFDFHLGIWPCVLIMLGLFIIFRIIALGFLYALRTKQQ